MPASEGNLILARRARLARSFLRHGSSLLDLGCGNGAQTMHFSDDFDQLIGIDVNADFLDDFAASVTATALENRITLHRYDGRELPLPSESIDCATSFEVLEHVADENLFLRELRRVLRPGGRLVLSVPNRWWIFETHGADLPLLPWNRVPLFSWLPSRLHDRWARARIYRRREIVRLVENAGFLVLKTTLVTAPMDVVNWPPLRRLLRRSLFRGDETRWPWLATSVLVYAERPADQESVGEHQQAHRPENRSPSPAWRN